MSLKAIRTFIILLLCSFHLVFLSSCYTSIVNDAQDGDIEAVREKLRNNGYIDINEKYDGHGHRYYRNVKYCYKGTSLHYLAQSGHTDIVRLLIDKGAKLNLKDVHNNTSLLLASCWGHSDIVRILLDAGADPNIGNSIPLICASSEGHSDIVYMLLYGGADTNVRDRAGTTALHEAAGYGHTSIVRFLLDSGAKINARNGISRTALHEAAENGRYDIVNLLLERGALKSTLDYEGMTPMMLAENKRHKSIVSLLQSTDEGSYFVKASSHSIKEKSIKEQTSSKKELASQRRLSISKRWAIVVGVSNYRDSRIQSLRYASEDARAFYKWLISPEGGKYPPANVRLLIDQEATAENIRNALYVWLKQAIEEDLVTIYIAGHGSPESPDELDNLFLLPYDTQYDKIAATGFPMWDIETALKRFIRAKRVVVIADACHSAGVGQSFDLARRAGRGIKINPVTRVLQNLTNIGEGVCVLTASDHKQYSQEDRKWGGGHGVFTYFLLTGLKGKADYSKDGRVTLGELIPYVSEKVRRETGSAQCPTVAGQFDPALTIGK